MAGRPYTRISERLPSKRRYRWSRRLYHGGDGCERRSTLQNQSRALVRGFDCAFVGRMAPPCLTREGVVHSALGSIGADTDGPPWKVRGRARTTHPPPEPRGVAPPLTEGTAVRACRRRADRFTALAHDRGTSRARAARRTHRSDGTPGTARRRSPRRPIGGTRAGTASSRSPWAQREPIRLDALSPFARCRMTETATTRG